MEKLVHTMVMGSSKVIQNYASILVAYHFYEIMRRKFLDIGEERLDHFKRVAIHFLLSQELGSHKKRCGKVMVSTILELSLHHNRDWNAFVKVASMGFVSWKAGIQDMILDIFVELNVILQCRFCKLLRPLLQRPHFNVLLEMLERGHDVRPFYILPSISEMLPRMQWSLLVEAATSSCLFASPGISSLKKVHTLTN
ncbi:hypothetical protein Pfo_010921 [Paulownia fortunei]|nr:hypothetical protein Pfo_010921 [Paulownia fortunei]